MDLNAIFQAVVATSAVVGLLVVLCWHGMFDPRRPAAVAYSGEPVRVPFLRLAQFLIVFGIPLLMDRAMRLTDPTAEPNRVLCALSGFAVAYVVTDLLTGRAARARLARRLAAR